MYRELAEVIQIENGHYYSYDFDSWVSMSEMAALDRGLHDDWVRTVQFEIVNVPRIGALDGRDDRLPRQSFRFNRRNLFARQPCLSVLRPHFPMQQLSIDHVVPRSRGGETSWENVVCSCLTCNTKKGGRTPQRGRMNLLKPPAKPTHNPLLAVKLVHTRNTKVGKRFCPTPLGPSTYGSPQRTVNKNAQGILNLGEISLGENVIAIVASPPSVFAQRLFLFGDHRALRRHFGVQLR